jgi:excisionase family DNA binding protein
MKLLTSSEAAKILHIHTETLREWANKHYIRCSRTTGGHMRFPLEDVNRVLADQEAGLGHQVLHEDQVDDTQAGDAVVAIPAAENDPGYIAYCNEVIDNERAATRKNKVMSYAGFVFSAFGIMAFIIALLIVQFRVPTATLAIRNGFALALMLSPGLVMIPLLIAFNCRKAFKLGRGPCEEIVLSRCVSYSSWRLEKSRAIAMAALKAEKQETAARVCVSMAASS